MHTAHWSRLFGDRFTFQSSFFNWIIVDPETLPKLLRLIAQRPLVVDDLEIDGVPALKGMHCWFMHESSNDSPLNLQCIVEKFNHLRGKFLKLGGLSDRRFIICNADSNLRSYHMWKDGRLNLRFEERILRKIAKALDELFAQGNNELLVATARDFSPTIAWPYRTAVMERGNNWQGNESDWDAFAALAAQPRSSPRFFLNSIRSIFPKKIRQSPTILHFDKIFAGIHLGSATLNNGRLCLDGSDGVGFYGPYVRLYAGTYEARIIFDRGSVDGIATMDVVGGDRHLVLGKKRIDAATLSPGPDQHCITALLRVALAQDLSFVEIRLFCENGFRGRVRALQIEKLA